MVLSGHPGFKIIGTRGVLLLHAFSSALLCILMKISAISSSAARISSRKIYVSNVLDTPKANMIYASTAQLLASNTLENFHCLVYVEIVFSFPSQEHPHDFVEVTIAMVMCSGKQFVQATVHHYHTSK